MQSKQNNTKNSGNNQRSRRQLTKQDPALVLRPAYPGQYVTTIKLLGDPATISTTVTSGVIADVANVNITAGAGGVNNFATRFAIYEEYRVVKAECEYNFFSSTNSGLGNFWVDEISIAAPTATEAQQRLGIKSVSCSAVNRTHTLTYVPHNPTEQTWNPIGGFAYAAFKFYTDNANFGSSIVATPYYTRRIIYTVQFRGCV